MAIRDKTTRKKCKVSVFTIGENAFGDKVYGDVKWLDSIEELNRRYEDYDENKWPQIGDLFYAVCNDGVIRSYIWDRQKDSRGEAVFNVFRTYEEAKTFYEEVSK